MQFARGHTCCSNPATMSLTRDDDNTNDAGGTPSRRTFVAQVAGLTMCGGALGALLQGCGGVTSPSDVPALQSVNGTRVNGGVTVAIE